MATCKQIYVPASPAHFLQICISRNEKAENVGKEVFLMTRTPARTCHKQEQTLFKDLRAAAITRLKNKKTKKIK